MLVVVFMYLLSLLLCTPLYGNNDILLPSGSKDTLSADDFRNPDRDCAPMTWWHWINGHVTRQGIRKDLEAIHSVGLRGVQVFNTHMYSSRGRVGFASDEWFDMIGYSLHLCDSLGLKLCITSGPGWSGSGGPWISKEQAMKMLVFSETEVEGGNVSQSLNVPQIKEQFYREIAVLAVPSGVTGGQIKELDEKKLSSNRASLAVPSAPSSADSVLKREDILNLTDMMDSDGVLRCELPAGRWTILRFGYTLTGKKVHPAAWGGDGYEVDKLDSLCVRQQFDSHLKVLFEKNSKYLGDTFEGVLFDSYEAGFQNWTASLPERFEEMYGYRLIDWLPVFTGRPIMSMAQSEKVLFDFRRLLDRLISEQYYGYMNKRINSYGLVTYSETQGGPVPSEALNHVDVPMNEFWNPDTYPRLKSIRLTATQAELKGRQIVAAESFTSKPEDGKWQNSPGSMKRAGDLAYIGGINRFCFHTYAHQPSELQPGFGLGRYGTLFGRHSTWWDYSGEWIDYLTRCQYVLQKGVKVADVCWLFHYDIRYNYPSQLTFLPRGYDYRIAYPEDLEDVRVVDRSIVFPNGAESKVLAVPAFPQMDERTAQVLEELKAKGAVIVQGNEVADALIAGRIQPDFDVIDTSLKLEYLHKKVDGMDVYMISNQGLQEVDTKVRLRSGKKFCSLWNPVAGSIYEGKLVPSGEFAVVDLKLQASGSVFCVMSDSPIDAELHQELVLSRETDVASPWRVSFEDASQTTRNLKMRKLVTLDKNAHDDVRYYSGTIVYENQFTLGQKDLGSLKSVSLSLGNVYDICEVIVNGQSAGVLWTYPYEMDITSMVTSGANEIKIRVASSWINRIIGDEFLETDLKYETTGSKFTIGRLSEVPDWIYEGKVNGPRRTFTTWKHYDRNSPLVPSGLDGKVTVRIYE